MYELIKPAKAETPSFTASLGNEMTQIIFAPNGTPSKSYYVHSNKLRAESAYFAKLLPPGVIEGETKKVTLSEGYEGLQAALECFIEWLYTGRYRCELDYSELSHTADIIVLTEKLLAKRCQKEAIANLKANFDAVALCSQSANRSGLNSQSTAAFAVLKVFPTVIQKIYEGVPRPPGPGFRELYDRCVGLGKLAKPPVSQDSIKEGENLVQTLNSGSRLSAFSELGPVYTNCRVRKLVAEHASRYLPILRESMEFRAIVQDIGEFAFDLMMECVRAPGGGGGGNSGVSGLIDVID